MIDAVAPRTDTETGRRQRFDALFAAFSSDIVAYCGWRAGASEAQDAVAEVFLTAWRRLDEVPEGDAARVWLYATARRVIANQRRSQRRRVALQERLALEPPPTPTEPASEGEETLVHDALRDSRPATGRCCCWRSGRGSRLPRSPRWSAASR
jgi:DNA-directed RNA polymerase specialized sigma24 family protein